MMTFIKKQPDPKTVDINALANTPWINWLDGQHDEMLAFTIQLANINSGSFNAQGVNRVGLELASYCRLKLGIDVEHLDVDPYELIDDKGDKTHLPLGQALRFRCHPKAPLQIFLCAHLDTVFASDHPFQTTHWLDSHRLQGPGVTDLKGGIMVMLNALQALERSPWAGNIGWEVLLTPDEEIGSAGSSPFILDAAQHCQLGLIYEPCFEDGNLAGARKGSGNFTVVARGRTAHAGREHHLGRNAIRAMSDFVSGLDNLNGQRPGVTINPGFIKGGGPVNAVPELCILRFNIRLQQPEDEQWCWQRMNNLINAINTREGIQLSLSGQFTRKPKMLSPVNLQLFELLCDCGNNLGLKLHWQPTGGCCDGNNLAAAGLPNIDTLGVQGGGIHSDKEYIDTRSLVERAKLSALLLMTLASSEDWSWLQAKQRPSPQGDRFVAQ